MVGCNSLEVVILVRVQVPQPMKFKNDKYRRVRGGYSRLLKISCQKCESVVCQYQKDGPGNLRRVYLDRISEPKVTLSGKILKCPKGHVLAVRTVYEKEGRSAFRLFVDAITKKILKA